LAAAHSWEQLQAIFPTLRDNEIRLLYKLTFEYRSTYNVGTKKAALRVVDDLRKQKITSTAVASGTLPATSVIFTPNTILTSTNVQSALDEILTDFVDKTTAQTIAGVKTFSDKASFGTETPPSNTRIHISDASYPAILLERTGAVTSKFRINVGQNTEGDFAIIDDKDSQNRLLIDTDGNIIISTTPVAESTTANPPVTRDTGTGALKTGGKKIVSVASDTTPNPTGWAYENEYYLTALAGAAAFEAPSGTPVNGNTLLIRVKDDGTARALTYNSIYKGFSQTLPATTIVNKEMYLGFIYNSATSKWDLISVVNEV